MFASQMMRTGTGASLASGSAFAPDDIASLEAWFDATTGVADSAGTVTSWTDRHSSILLDDITNAPITGTRTLNGLNVVDFTNIDGVGDVTSGSFLLANSTAKTLFAVVVLDENNASKFALATGGNGTNTNRLQLKSQGGWAIGDGVGSQTLSTGAQLLTCWFNGSGAGVTISAQVRKLAATTESVTVTGTGDELAIGGFPNNSGVTSNMDGAVAEFLSYNAELTAQQRSDVQDYLIARWGL